jgi:uncharacterized protein YheU (UPF0270 family)
MLQIPPDHLSADVLDALVEEFVTRHGTDLTDAATKAAQVRAQLTSGEVVIVWDEKTESANIVSKDAKEEPPPPEPPRFEEARVEEARVEEAAVPRRERRPARRGPIDEDGRHIVYDEPAAPDPTDY